MALTKLTSVDKSVAKKLLVPVDAALAVHTADIETNTNSITDNTTAIAVNAAAIVTVAEGQTAGVIVFATYALLDAYTPTTAQEKASFKVTDDSNTSLNGYYSWVGGTVYSKDASLVVNTIDANNTSDAVSGSAVDKSEATIRGNVDTQPTIVEGYAYNSNGDFAVSATRDCFLEPIKCLTDKLYVTNVADGSLSVGAFSASPPSSGNKLVGLTYEYLDGNATVTLPVGTKYALISPLQTTNMIDSGVLVSSFNSILISKDDLDSKVAHIPLDLINEDIVIVDTVNFVQEYLNDFEVGREYRFTFTTDSPVLATFIQVRTKLLTSVKDNIIVAGDLDGIGLNTSVYIFTPTVSADRVEFKITTPSTDNNVNMVVRDALISPNVEFDKVKSSIEYMDTNLPLKGFGYGYNSNGDAVANVAQDILPVLDTTNTDVIYLGTAPLFAYGFTGTPASGTKLNDQLGDLELLDNGFYKFTLVANCNKLCIALSSDDSAEYPELFTARPPYQKYNEKPNAPEQVNIAINDFSIANIHDQTVSSRATYSTTSSEAQPLPTGYAILRLPVISEIPSSNYIITLYNAKVGGTGDHNPQDLYYYVYDKSDLTTIVYEGVFAGDIEAGGSINAGNACTVIFNNELYVFYLASAIGDFNLYMRKVNSATSFDAPVDISAITGRFTDVLGSMKGFQYDATNIVMPMINRENGLSDSGFYVLDMTVPTVPVIYWKWIGRGDVSANECNVYLSDDGVNIIVSARCNQAYRVVREVGYAELDTLLEDYLGNERPANLCMESWLQSGNTLLRSAINPDTFSTGFNRVNLTLFLSLDNGRNLTKLFEYESGGVGFGYSDMFIDSATDDLYLIHETGANIPEVKVITAAIPTTVSFM